jgi:hypothetical protein
MSTPDVLFERLRQFRTSWPKAGWSWDNRLSCAASSFGVELVRDAHAVVSQALPNEWTMKNLAGAPATVRDIAQTTGGIRPDQFLLASEAHGRLVAYALWWPWGDDVTISLRVGLAGYASEADWARFREIFGIAEV